MAVTREDIERIARADAAARAALSEGRPKEAVATVCEEFTRLGKHHVLRGIYTGVAEHAPDGELLHEFSRRLELFGRVEREIFEKSGFNTPEARAMLDSVCLELRPQFVRGVISEAYIARLSGDLARLRDIACRVRSSDLGIAAAWVTSQHGAKALDQSLGRNWRRGYQFIGQLRFRYRFLGVGQRRTVGGKPREPHALGVFR